LNLSQTSNVNLLVLHPIKYPNKGPE